MTLKQNPLATKSIGDIVHNVDYLRIIDRCDCGSDEWQYENIPDGSRKTCKKCGNVVEVIWETAVTDNDGNYYFPSDKEEKE